MWVFLPRLLSVAGNFPPASCIFSEVMNLAAFVGKSRGRIVSYNTRRLNTSLYDMLSLVSFREKGPLPGISLPYLSQNFFESATNKPQASSDPPENDVNLLKNNLTEQISFCPLTHHF